MKPATESPNVSQLIRGAEIALVTGGVPNARRNAEWMLSHVLGCRSADLYLDTQRVPDADAIESYHTLVARRVSREPLQYILGTTEFMSLPFCTAPGVFIPRPDTECLAELAESFATRDMRVLDLCCGSGVIGVSLLRRVPGLRVTAVDLDPTATTLTRRNAELNGVAERLTCESVEGVAFLSAVDAPYDMIVCNPPYIPRAALADLPPEVRDHEPALSLDGGREGLDFYQSVAPLLVGALRPGAPVLFEIGADQARAVTAILEGTHLVDIAVHRDYAGKDRVVTAWTARPSK